MRLQRGLAIAAAALALGACSTTSGGPAANPQSYADFLVGRVAHLTNDYDQASDRYLAALVRDPGNQTLVDGAVSAALAQGDLARAREAAVYARGPDAPAYALMLRAADALAARRWRDAETTLRLAHGDAAQTLAIRALQVWTSAAQGRVEPIDAEVRPLMSISPFGGLFNYQQGMALDFAGRGDEALTFYAAAASGDVWLPPAVERLADLLARRGQRDEAERILAASGELNPSIVAALARLHAGGDVASAPLTPARGAAISLYGLAQTYLQQSDTGDGLALLTLCLALDPGLDPARLAYAQAQVDLQQQARAIAVLRQVPANSPYAASARIAEAWALIDEGQPDAAVALLRAGGDEFRYTRALGDVYRSLHRDEEAEAAYTQLIAARPGDWRLFYARGAARQSLGRVEEGEADLQRALEISPQQPEVLNYLGYSWVDRGVRVEEGLAMVQRAATMRPNSGAIIDSLAWAYYRQRDYTRAVENAERAIELEPGDATLNDHLGDIYWRAGRQIEARYQWRRALALNPADPAAIQAKLDHGLAPDPAAHSGRR